MNILIVEDDINIGKRLKKKLSSADFTNVIEHVQTIDSAMQKITSEVFDLILVDIILIGQKNTGIDLCKRIRKQYPNIPIIILTSVYSIHYIEMAFSLGVNDYMTKPFNIKELEIRIKRWQKIETSKTAYVDKIDYKGLTYRQETGEILYNGNVIPLTKKRKNLLLLFLQRPERLLSPEYLQEKFWGDYDLSRRSRNIRSNIQHLREDLDKHGANWIQNVRGEGYILKK